MDLDLLAESESDDESIHSNQDNVSVQRSAVTMATAGSDAGKLTYKVIQFTAWVVESIKIGHGRTFGGFFAKNCI